MKALSQGILAGVLAVFTTVAIAVPTEGHKLMISGPSPYAVEIGKEIAERGGNVADVAVAVALSLSVTSPYFGSLGGGGFALIKMDKNVHALDFREMAPKATHPKYYIDKKEGSSKNGGAAVGVPGIPAGLYEIHKKYGRIEWSQLFVAPLKMAERGYRVSGEWVKKTNSNKDRFNKAGLNAFFKGKKFQDYAPGEILKQKNLAKALKLFRDKKLDGFYKGPVAKDIADTVQKTGGVITTEDMANYKVRWLKPLTTEYKGHKIYLMPPPSSGGVVIKTALELIEKVKLEKYPFMSVDELHMLGEILSRSYRGRALLGDPDFHKNPYDRILSKTYIDEMAHTIELDKTRELEPLKEDPIKESNETTHFSVLDAKGNSIAMTITLNGSYGSGVVSNKYGIALNNEMDDFTTFPGKPNMYGLVQGNGNLVEPGKRPLSSMSPTLVTKKGKVVMSLGSPGGPRIISGVTQVLYRVLATGLDMDQAIQAPRIHHQFLPRKVFVDTQKWAPETLSGLRKRGHQVEESWMGRVYGIRKTKDGILEAGFDSRGEGAAGGF